MARENEQLPENSVLDQNSEPQFENIKIKSPVEEKKRLSNVVRFVLVILFSAIVFLAVAVFLTSAQETYLLETETAKIITSYETDKIFYNAKGLPYTTGEKEVIYTYFTDQEAKIEDGEIYEKRTENTIFYNNNTAKIYSGQQFHKINDQWFYTDTGKTTKEIWDQATKPTAIQKLFGRSVFAEDYYTGAGDGLVQSTCANNWATTHDAIDGGHTNYTNSGADAYYTYVYYDSTPQWCIGRGFIPFDTSAIEDTATIASASLYVYVSSKGDTLDDDEYAYISVYQTTQASNTELANADYDQIGTTQGATAIDIDSLSAASYNAFSLNSTGISWISKTGYTKLGTREGHDAENQATPQTEGENKMYIRFSEYAGTDYDPYLKIELEDVASVSDTDLASASISDVNQINLNFIIYLAGMFFFFITGFKMMVNS